MREFYRGDFARPQFTGSGLRPFYFRNDIKMTEKKLGYLGRIDYSKGLAWANSIS
jgi:hypothetical protein